MDALISYLVWMQAARNTVFVNRATIILIARLAGEVFGLGGVLYVATTGGQHIKSWTNKSSLVYYDNALD